ncbi:hypothetical protein L218DRAFT_651955 [Marasmius fiardii PR-910]|nr:hypothetical protein L218DRAFT_651955 [Marasmius fiardii PR-910]
MDQMSVNDLILQPLTRDLPKHGCRGRAIGEFLETKGGMESSRYERFKDHVRQWAVIYLSDPHARHKKQPSREWEVFSSKMTAEYPELARFHNCWPLILYFNDRVGRIKRDDPKLNIPSSSSGLQKVSKHLCSICRYVC